MGLKKILFKKFFHCLLCGLILFNIIQSIKSSSIIPTSCASVPLLESEIYPIFYFILFPAKSLCFKYAELVEDIIASAIFLTSGLNLEKPAS